MSHSFDQDFARLQDIHNSKPETQVSTNTAMSRGDLDLIKRLSAAISLNSADLTKFELVDGDKTVAGPAMGSNAIEERARIARTATEQKKHLPHAYNPEAANHGNPNGRSPDEIRFVKPSIWESPGSNHPHFGEPIHLKPIYEPLPIELKPLAPENPPFFGRPHHDPFPITIKPFGEPLPAFDKPIGKHDPIFDRPWGTPVRPYDEDPYDTRPYKPTPYGQDKPYEKEVVALVDWPDQFTANQPDGSMRVVDEKGVKTYWPNGSVNVKNFDGTGYMYNPPKDANDQPEYKHWGPKPEDNYSEDVLIFTKKDMLGQLEESDLNKILKNIEFPRHDETTDQYRRFEGARPISVIQAPSEFQPNQPDGSMEVVNDNGVFTYYRNGAVNVKRFDATGYSYNPDGKGGYEYKHWGQRPEDNYQSLYDAPSDSLTEIDSLSNAVTRFNDGTQYPPKFKYLSA